MCSSNVGTLTDVIETPYTLRYIASNVVSLSDEFSYLKEMTEFRIDTDSLITCANELLVEAKQHCGISLVVVGLVFS